MARLTRLVTTPFGIAALGLLVLAGWAAWTAGVFDSPVARQVRSSSVYVAPGIDLDQAAAEKVIGNRRLVVVFLDRNADLAEACDDLDDAAAGTLVMLFKPGDGEFDHYGCAQFYDGDIADADSDTFGKALAMENTAPEGADQFLTRPLDAVKIVAVNYDRLVKTGTVPDGARTIDPSAPRYVLAVAAVLTVVGGAVTVFIAGRRIGRLAARHQERDETVSDARASVNAKSAVLARHIIELDRRPTKDTARLAAEYAELATHPDDPDLAERIESLTERARNLNRTAAPARSRRRSRRAPSR